MKQRGFYRCLAALLTLTLTVTAITTSASATSLGIDPTAAPPPIPDVWARADGPAVRTGDHQSWVWGPVIHSVTHEPYYDSPGGARVVFYFDKARMEINDPTESWTSPWYATSGLLVKEMILGQIQVGNVHTIPTAPAEIPVTGDLLDNPESPTYASLSLHTTLGDGNAHREAAPRTGAVVTELLRRDGSVQTGFGAEHNVTIAAYDDLLGHNIPAVFWDWMNQQPLDWDYLVGHAITEPFWANTRVAGVDQLVLVQAFERRILTYTPSNPAEWQVEAGNAGLHYRAWRNLSMPADQSLVGLAFSLPMGEIITGAAVRHGIDAYLFAALAMNASNFDPLAKLAADRIGAFAVPAGYIQQLGAEYPYDPTVNAEIAATLLASLYAQSGDWRTAVERYMNWSDGTVTTSSIPSQIVTDVNRKEIIMKK